MNTHKPNPSKPIDTTNLEPVASQGKLNTVHEMYTITKLIRPADIPAEVDEFMVGFDSAGENGIHFHSKLKEN